MTFHHYLVVFELSSFRAQRLSTDKLIEEERESNLLYVAAAMATTKSTKFRLGHPILSMKEGDRINVFQEDADSPDSGGSGWVFGQLANGVRGFARTESLYIV